MKIYTKTGDKGKTSLLGGQRVEKNHPKLICYGTIDELNSHIGLLIQFMRSEKLNADKSMRSLLEIQNQLFIVGSHVACLDEEDRVKFKLPELKSEIVESLEAEIDAMESDLTPLKNFILPGGSLSASQTHICRTVCRRAERHLAMTEEENYVFLIYLNRLADYFFVLARHLNHVQNIDDIIWNSKK